jgi:hypothetical protein
VEQLARQNAAMQETLQRLEREVHQARDAARAAADMARVRAPELPAVAAHASGVAPPVSDGTLLSASLGRANLQLLDLSLDVLTVAGGSSVRDEELENLQGGGHDPRQRGFTLPAAELSLAGAVDPFLDAEAHWVYFLDAEGETHLELEEAFATTRSLPFGLEERGLQVEVGQFFTEIGRLNAVHAHFWNWQDQPVILSRFFGEDGMRGAGLRLGWLTPLPWFSELHFGLQNAAGETMMSFLANDEVFEERGVGGRPFADVSVGSPDDLVQLLRWVNGFDISDTLSGQLGLSGLRGPNASGSDGRTRIYGADLVVKWRPLRTDRGWPFLVFESELLRRSYRADAFFGCPGDDPTACGTPLFVPEDTLRDWGLYTQLLWGFRRNWAMGVRYEYATGDGMSFNIETGRFVSQQQDPFRDDRHRVSPLLVWHPSEFSRLRMQYNYDRADHVDGKDAHSFWAGIEFLFGAHPAHSY